MLSCANLSLQYPDGLKKKTVFSGVDLEINKGENAILLGPSGSGKSSLLYLLSTLREPTEGEVFYQGHSLSSEKEKKKAEIRKEHFGFIFQMHFLLPYLTVLENVMVGNSHFNKETETKAADLLQRLGMYEDGRKRVHQLSGGQRQRVAIARALMNEPDVIFADEPTASLDHATAKEVLQVLKTYKRDMILVMATHDTSILSGDERIIRFTDGVVAS